MPDFIGVDRERVVGLRQALVEEVERQADWRTEKAAEYPDDAERNLRASAKLRALAASLGDLRDDDPLWLAYACAIGSGGFQVVEWLGAIIGAARFWGYWPSGDDGRQFLRELLRVQAEAA